MTKEEMLSKLKGLGVNSRFIPSWDFETGKIGLVTRKPAVITEGWLSGCEIVLMGGHFDVWTNQKQRVKTQAALHGLKARLFDGEAELQVPLGLADKLLPKFGAKVRRKGRELTENELNALKERLKLARGVHSTQKL